MDKGDIIPCEKDWSHGVWRYNQFKQFCAGKIVADVGCGSGLGSLILGTMAAKVHSYDIVYPSDPAPHLRQPDPNLVPLSSLDFRLIDLNKSMLPENYDVIVSSENIEHLVAPVKETIFRLVRCLNPGGIICLTHPENQPSPADYHLQFWIKNDDICSFFESIGFEILFSKVMPEHTSSWIVAKDARMGLSSK